MMIFWGACRLGVGLGGEEHWRRGSGRRGELVFRLHRCGLTVVRARGAGWDGSVGGKGEARQGGMRERLKEEEIDMR